MSDDIDDDESEGEPCPYCAEPNHLPSDTRCIHNVAWATLCNAVYEVEEDSPEDAQLQARALTVLHGTRLVQLAGLAAQCEVLCQTD